MIFDNPVIGAIAPTASGTGFRVTQDFGPATNTWEPKVVWPGGEGIKAGTYAHFHKGIDLGNRRCGADLLAMLSGTVHISTKTAAGENIIVVWFAGPFTDASIYGIGHLASRTVQKGAKVKAGQKVGTVGSTGNSTACHAHAFVKIHVDLRKNVYLNSNGDLLDLWRRLRQNVTGHPIEEDGINIRLTAGAGTISGPKFAQTKAGRIIRTDGSDLGPVTDPRKWLGTVAGATYSIAGVPGTTWESFELDGAPRFVASPLAVLSQK